jgi:uncharacterized metal-binding protein
MPLPSDDRVPACAGCGAVLRARGATHCWSPDPAAAPPRPGACPGATDGELAAAALAAYEGDGADARLARAAARCEGRAYAKEEGAVHARWTRVEDTIALAKEMGWRRVGIASCVGLLEETSRLAEVLRAQGLEPLPVCCKVGSVDKTELGLAEEEKVRPGTFEPLCNPVAQAEILNRLGSDVNVIMGLCVGHDMLFTSHARAPTTTLVAKDRVTGHHPAAPLHASAFYYRRLTKPAPG